MRLSLRSLRFLLAHSVLALLLLFSQQHAAVHRLLHAVQATHPKAEGALDRHCAECGALSALDAAAPVATLTALALQGAGTSGLATLHADAPRAASWPAFHSRAPPNLS